MTEYLEIGTLVELWFLLVLAVTYIALRIVMGDNH